MNFVKRFWIWLGRNATTTIALSSLCIALVSLIYTIRAQQNDAAYKELSIKPIVGVAANVSDFSLSYTNAGYGVGIVSRVSFAHDGKCYASDKIADKDFYEAYSKFMDATATRIYDSLVLPRLSTDLSGIHITEQAIDPSFAIRPGETFSVFYVDKPSIETILKADSATLNQARKSFANAARKIALNVTFCSATGQSCSTVATEDETCP